MHLNKQQGFVYFFKFNMHKTASCVKHFVGYYISMYNITKA